MVIGQAFSTAYKEFLKSHGIKVCTCICITIIVYYILNHNDR